MLNFHQLGDFNDDLAGFFYGFQVDKFVTAVKIMAAAKIYLSPFFNGFRSLVGILRAQELTSSFDRHLPVLRQVEVVDPHYDESIHHWLNDPHD